jgi:hypothetical protein
MLRRGIRIFAVVGLIGIIAAAIANYWLSFSFMAGPLVFESTQVRPFFGVYSSAGTHYGPDWYWFAWRGWFFRPKLPWDYLGLPKWGITVSHGWETWVGIDIPWWLLVLSWALLTAVIFRLTRQQKARAGFPVEPALTPR